MEEFEEFLDALEVTVKLGDGISIDAYLLRDGTIRYGFSQTSILLGYESRYYSQVVRRRPKKLEALRRIGFAGGQLPVRVKLPTGGFKKAKTFSFDDFCIVIEYEAIEVKNSKAIGILGASLRDFIRSRTLEAFGLPEEDLETRKIASERAFRERESVWAENQAEISELILPGDEGLDVAAYYPEISKWENDYLAEKYFDDFDAA